ncbi:MAG: response regulator transcription factor [Dehalococcoidia bacterium]|nr:response regulator transcription factor [Dehalococcoidia bacterium]
MPDILNKPARVLVVEDDQTLSGVLKYNLSKEGYLVLSAVDGAQALEVARTENPDIILLDIMMPKLNGLEVCRILRKESNIPILMLTAKSEEVDRVVGLELGADDYMSKPFGVHELMARVKAMLRRCQMNQTDNTKAEANSIILRTGNIEIDELRHTISVNDKFIEFTPREFELMAFLIRNRGRVFRREQLLDKVWGYDYAGDTRTVDVHISWLRQKIENNPQKPTRLVTIRGVGYKFEE